MKYKIICILFIIVFCIIVGNVYYENMSNNNKPYLIWLEKSLLWETDYILNDLLKNKYREKIVDLNDNITNNNDIINNNIIVFSSNSKKYNEIFPIVKKLKPKLIIHLSDEGTNGRGITNIYLNLSNYCKLYTRQYYHHNYDYSLCKKKNILFLPLAYNTGMLETNYKNIKLKLPNKRRYKWSFIGAIKKDRQEMINTMDSIKPNFHGSEIDKPEMRDIYRDSIFVCNGRGWSNLDCFRLYEASICGAIPVVVGLKEEYDNTFKFMDNPPWIRFDSWDEAKEECNYLLENDMDKLNNQHIKLIKWWDKLDNKTKNKINSVL